MKTKKRCLIALFSLLTGLSPGIGYASGGGHNAFVNLMRAGHEALNQQRWSSAASSFRYAVGWEPHNAAAHAGLGTALLHLGQTQKAADEFHAAQRYNRNNGQAEWGLRQTHQPEELEKEFQELAEQAQRQPRNAELHALYAEQLVDRNRFDDAQKEAQLALQIKPKLGQANYVLGCVAAQKGNDDEARRYFNVAITIDRRDDDAWGGLGDLAMKTRDYPTAIACYRHSVSIVPEEQGWHEKLRDAYQAAGDTQNAAQQQAILDSIARAPAK